MWNVECQLYIFEHIYARKLVLETYFDKHVLDSIYKYHNISDRLYSYLRICDTSNCIDPLRVQGQPETGSEDTPTTYVNTYLSDCHFISSVSIKWYLSIGLH